ncbi:MAG: diacylglycerol kinase family lipid kinase [Clostridiales bacterium]|nr:diacylglycerol kinase family lipid kinase [Clostridiales bacterium]
MANNRAGGLRDRKLFFIVNPAAGNGRGEREWRRLLPLLRRENWDFSWAFTEEPGSAPRQIRAALDGGRDLIVAVGGDGTAHQTLNALLQENGLYKEGSALAVWPVGSGCDFARMLYKSKRRGDLLNLLQNGRIENIDIARCVYTSPGGPQETYYLNSADAGLGADTCRRLNERNRKLFPKLAYFSSAIRSLLAYKYVPAAVESDAEVFRGEFLLAAVCNGRYFGGGMMPAPTASLNDGLLNLLLVRKMSKLKVLRVLPRIYRGKHLEVAGVEYLKVKEVKISAEAAISLETDGETAGYSDVYMRVLPGALPLLLPDGFD